MDAIAKKAKGKLAWKKNTILYLQKKKPKMKKQLWNIYKLKPCS